MHIPLDIKVEYAFAFVPSQKHHPMGKKLGEKMNIGFLNVISLPITQLPHLPVFLPSEKQMYILGWVKLQMHFIILHWRSSFVLKRKKLNQGIGKNFPKYSKLILWLSAPVEQLHLNLNCQWSKCRTFYQVQPSVYSCFSIR